MNYSNGYINNIKCDLVRKKYLSSIFYSCFFCPKDNKNMKNGDKN